MLEKNGQESRTAQATPSANAEESAAGGAMESDDAGSEDAVKKYLEGKSATDITAEIDGHISDLSAAIDDINAANAKAEAKVAFLNMMIMRCRIMRKYLSVLPIDGSNGGDGLDRDKDNRDDIDIDTKLINAFGKKSPRSFGDDEVIASHYAQRGSAYLRLLEYDSAIADLKAAQEMAHLWSARKFWEGTTHSIAELEAALKAELKDKYTKERFESVCKEMGW